ncbi:hypothetical protein TREES_T100012131 [Tupaia chinensis]|uniref:Uncharacterized protein n=1 Tax=Tupaia chinensis TaxID=246437 RepID=L9K0N7_TUPCH|nr:hypothetical protein TREES_T100012131 [Tupaia chinensis]
MPEASPQRRLLPVKAHSQYCLCDPYTLKHQNPPAALDPEANAQARVTGPCSLQPTAQESAAPYRGGEGRGSKRPFAATGPS